MLHSSGLVEQLMLDNLNTQAITFYHSSLSPLTE